LLQSACGALKSIITDEYIKNVKCHNWKPFKNKLWQRNYYEHIIRNEKSYIKISEYIRSNPFNWMHDKCLGGLRKILNSKF